MSHIAHQSGLGFLAHPVLFASYSFSYSQNAQIELNIVNSHTLWSCLRIICSDFDRLLIKLASYYLRPFVLFCCFV